MRNLAVIFLFLALSVFIGCLGMGGGGSSSSVATGPSSASDSVISGNIHFPYSSLYGGITVFAKDASDLVMGSTITDSYGNFNFKELVPGVYDLYATTGESEIKFYSGAQVLPDRTFSIPQKELLELKNVVLDKITSSSVRLMFETSSKCSSQVEYSYSTGQMETALINSSPDYNHEVVLTNLYPDTRYGFILKLQNSDGQQFVYSALSTRTNKAIGPNNLSVNIENGETYTRFQSVRLYLEADNAIEVRIGDKENLQDEPWQGFSPFSDYTLPSGDGTKRVYVQFRDEFGNLSSVINDSIQLQTSVEGYIGVWINEGEALTNDYNVVLSMLYPGATHMKISDRSDFLNSFWEPYTELRKFSFDQEDGLKTIYVRYRGGNADSDKTYSASIVLDTTGPEVTMQINNGALKTNNINLRLNFQPIQTPSEMQLEEDGTFDEESTWIKFSNPYTFLISKGDGEKEVYARFRDELGNVYGPISAQIELDTTPPQNAEFQINDGDDTADKIEVRLTISADEASKIMISNDETFSGAVTESYKTIKNWSLAGYGVQSVYMKFIDDASNTTSALVQSIEVIGEPPSSGSVKINQDDPSSRVATVSLYVFSDDVEKIRVGTHQNFSSLSDIEFQANYPGGVMKIDDFVLDPSAGKKYVYVRFQDSTGNFSVASDSIVLSGPASYSLTSPDSQPLSTYTVSLRPFAEDAAEMLLTEDYLDLAKNNKWQPFKYSLDFVLNSFAGKHTVYAKYRNSGGVETPVLSLDLTVSEIAPASPAILINVGDTATKRSNVQVKVLSNKDYPIMRLSNDGNFFDKSDTAAVDQPWYIDKKAGEKVVYARFQHKDTGTYFYAQDSITAVGPASPTINTRDSLPLNKNWVLLNLYAKDAIHMIVTEDPNIDALPENKWEPYRSELPFPLVASYTGTHKIYAKFRNAATNYIETEAVELSVSVNEISPSGNNALILETAAADSTEVEVVPIASLPVYLHFDIADPLTATISWKIASSGAPLPQTYNKVAAPVAPIPLSEGDFPGNGTFNVYYKFSDGVGNETALNVLSIKILGPSIKISPATLAPLNSGQTQQFSATLENVEGTVRWSINPNTPSDEYGSINSITGLYSAPASVDQNASTTVRAELLGDSSVNDSVKIELETQVEVITPQTNYQITKSIAPDINSTDIRVEFKNSNQIGTVVSPTPLEGTAVINPYSADPEENLATLTYTAPSTSGSDNVEITSSQDQSKKKIIYFTVNDGPWITITPENAEMRVKDGSKAFAADTSSMTGTLYWSLPDGGFFDSDKTQATTTTPGNGSHNVTVYAPDTKNANPITLVASFPDGTKYESSITLQSAVEISVAPALTKMYLGETTSTLFAATLKNATSSEVIWEFKNASETDWKQASFVDDQNGVLSLNQTEAEYLPPATWPSSAGNPVKKIDIRAYSIDDNSASDTVVVELIQPLQVNIYDGYNAQGTNITNSSISVTLEVGTRQLFAEVGPVTDPTTNTTVNWLVQDIANGNDTYGTIDTTGKFSAPDTAPQAAVTVKAVSVAETSALAETTVNLLDFWTPRNEGLTADTSAIMPVYCLEVDPTSPAGSERVIYCGTNGFGAYRATVPTDGSDYDWDDIEWSGVTSLSTDLVGLGAQYVINDIAISRQHSNTRVVAATNNGLFLINGTNASQITVPTVRNYPEVVASYSVGFTQVFSSVVIDPTDDTYMYAAGKDQGVLRFKWNSGDYDYDGTLYDDAQSQNYVYYDEKTWSPSDEANASAPESLTYQEPMLGTYASGTMQFTAMAINPGNPNILYVGFTNYWESRDPDVFVNGYIQLMDVKGKDYLEYNVSSPFPYLGDFKWKKDEPMQYCDSNIGSKSFTFVSRASPLIYKFDTDSSIIHSIAVDPNTPTTIWVGKNSGVERSTNDGDTFSTVGNYVNVRDIFIDPINTINVYIGTESGLYRTKDAGASWKQIKTGLEGNTTLNTLDLTPGNVGMRRIFLGNTNGIFIGRTSLDLE
jgi:hypothetical protein